MEILVVDDHDLNRQLLRLNLQRAGHTVQLAVDGLDALRVLEECIDLELVITDLMMPELDGLGLIERMRGRPAFAQLPIIVCSARADLPTVRSAAGLGVRNFLVKPVSRETLFEQMEAALRAASPALTPRADLEVQLGLDDEQYYELLWQFADELGRLSSWIRQGLVGEAPEPGPDLRAMGETAALFGAQRFAQRLLLLAKNPAPLAQPESRRAFFVEVAALRRAIGARVSDLEAEAAGASRPSAGDAPTTDPPR